MNTKPKCLCLKNLTYTATVLPPENRNNILKCHAPLRDESSPMLCPKHTCALQMNDNQAGGDATVIWNKISFRSLKGRVCFMSCVKKNSKLNVYHVLKAQRGFWSQCLFVLTNKIVYMCRLEPIPNDQQSVTGLKLWHKHLLKGLEKKVIFRGNLYYFAHQHSLFIEREQSRWIPSSVRSSKEMVFASLSSSSFHNIPNCCLALSLFKSSSLDTHLTNHPQPLVSSEGGPALRKPHHGKEQFDFTWNSIKEGLSMHRQC